MSEAPTTSLADTEADGLEEAGEGTHLATLVVDGEARLVDLVTLYDLIAIIEGAHVAD